MSGFVLLHRKLLQSTVFQSEGLLKVWVWCLCRANYQPETVVVKTGPGERVVKLQPGQFIYGRKKAAKSLKMAESTVRRRMKILEDLENVDRQSFGNFSIITVKNWQKYQWPEDERTGSDTSSEPSSGQAADQAADTGNKNNKDKQGEQGEQSLAPPKKSKRFIAPTIALIREYCTQRKNNIDAEYFHAYYETRGWKTGSGVKMTKWKAAIITWEKNDAKRKKERTQPKGPRQTQAGYDHKKNF